MSDFTFDFGQVQQAPETPQFRACCHGPVQILRDLAEAVRDGTVDAKDVQQQVPEAMGKLPSTVTSEDAAELKAAVAGLINVMESKPGFSEAQAVVTVGAAMVDLHVKAAQAGAQPTAQQVAELGEAAMRVNALVKEHVSGSTAVPFVSELQSRTEVFIKQAQDANPLFGLSMASAAAPEARPQSSEPVHKGGSHETTKEAAVEQKSSAAQEGSKSAEASIKERGPELVKETVAEVAKAVRSEVGAEQRKVTSEPQTQRVETVERRQAAPVEASVVSAVAKVAAPAGSSPTLPSQQASATPAAVVARSLPTPPQSASYSVSQRALVPSSSVPLAPSVARAGAATSSPRVGMPSERGIAATVQRVASVAGAPARGAAVSRGATTTPGTRPTARSTQAVRPNGVRAPGEQLARAGGPRVGGPRAEGPVAGNRVKGATTLSPDGRVVVNGRAVLAPPVQRVSTMLAHLRGLSPKEIKGIRLERFDRPKDVQVALAIRARAQKIIERIKSLPLKDIVKIKGLRAETKMGKGGTRQTALSARELLARREVRLLIRDLSARLQSFLNPRSMLYKRVMSELTLSDLERLVSILGGNRAVKGLRKKHKAGEVTEVFESDISNSFLSQLASASTGPSGVSDSGGADEPSASPEGGGAEASTEASTEEATLVADGAVPTATLSTFIMKEETVGNSM
jgi:hypothetical protein